LPIFGYGNIDDAIDYVNARPRPLALYYFGGDLRKSCGYSSEVLSSVVDYVE
jgi:hypothetical protein